MILKVLWVFMMNLSPVDMFGLWRTLDFLPKVGQSFIFCSIRSKTNLMLNHLSKPTIHKLVGFIPVADSRCSLIDFCGGKVTKSLGDESLVKPWLMYETQVRPNEVLLLIYHHSLTKSIFSALIETAFFSSFLPQHCRANHAGFLHSLGRQRLKPTGHLLYVQSFGLEVLLQAPHCPSPLTEETGSSSVFSHRWRSDDDLLQLQVFNANSGGMFYLYGNIVIEAPGPPCGDN